ncbi:MAG: AAA family ATPase [Methylococcales bacterium]|nr:AAA family ATPase [Methylococcales bacterium]
MSTVKISSIKFTNFKSLSNYSVSLQETNILVGPNNAGKSTIISAFRILEVALKKARRLKAERVSLPAGSFGFGHKIPEEQISVSLENVATNYNSEDSRIEFRLTNKNKLMLFFPNGGGCIFHWETEGASVSTPVKFKTAFPINIQVVPILGPLEHEEAYVSEDTVKNSLNTHRASRHFRNYWHYFKEGWDEFSNMISSTWPGMEIMSPELDIPNRKLSMFVSESRIDREVYWAGFGFQIWCQLLTHLSRANDVSLVVIDEPEIYLHPDVQRQLLTILRNLNADVLLATHSVEIMGEADPSEILLVNKEYKSARRLKDVEGIQFALESLGSAQNVTLTHLARTKKIVFVEGMDDYKIIRRFAQNLGFIELSAGNNLTAFESGGFSSWERIKSFAWGVKKTIDTNMKLFAVYDRDYYCDEQLNTMLSDLQVELTDAHIHERKEIDNYFLNITVLERVLDKQIANKKRRTGDEIEKTATITSYLENITKLERASIQAQYIAKRLDYKPNRGIDSSTISKQAIESFEQLWAELDSRMTIVPGKNTLRMLRDSVQKDYGVNLTDVQIIDEFRNEEIPDDLKSLIHKLENFCVS